MTFTPEQRIVPTSIGTIIITLIDKPANGEPAIKTARYKVQVLNQNGNEMSVPEGDLVPHILQSDITWLLDFLARMRAKAEAELLP